MNNLTLIILIIIAVIFLGCSCSCKGVEGFGRKAKRAARRAARKAARKAASKGGKGAARAVEANIQKLVNHLCAGYISDESILRKCKEAESKKLKKIFSSTQIFAMEPLKMMMKRRVAGGEQDININTNKLKDGDLLDIWKKRNVIEQEFVQSFWLDNKFFTDKLDRNNPIIE